MEGPVAARANIGQWQGAGVPVSRPLAKAGPAPRRCYGRAKSSATERN